MPTPEHQTGTFVFADIAGYTALTEAHGDADAAELAARDERSDEARHLDPVCRMLVADGREVGTFKYDDTLYRFCSLECARRFLRDPDAYALPGGAR